MNEKDILNFKNEITNLSLDELLNRKLGLQEKLTKMILETDVITKIAILDTAIKEKSDGKTK